MNRSPLPPALAIFGVLFLAHLPAQTLKVFLLAGQSNQEGQAYTYDSAATEGWNIPTLEFLLRGVGSAPESQAAADYLAALEAAPFGFAPSLDPGWLYPRTDVWCVHYDSANGNTKNVQVSDDPLVQFNGIGPLSPGFGVGTNFGSMFGMELGMGIRLGDATADPVFLFKSDRGGTTLAEDWRPPSALARGGVIGPHYQQTLADFTAFLDALDTDLGNDGVLNAYGNATGYEVCALVWLQGFNEVVENGGVFIPEYRQNMVDFVHDLRAADPRIPGSLPALVIESADQNEALNLERQAAVDALNGEMAGSAVFLETNNMKGVDWGPNESGASFTQGYGSHYHARAENYLEIGWLAAGAVLDNGYLSSSPFWIGIPAVTGLTPDHVTATANLNEDADEMIVAWDTSDQGTGAPGDWANQQSLGATSAGSVPYAINGLAEGTGYVVRFYAANTSPAAETWSPPTSFTTPWLNPPPLLGVPDVSSVTSAGATMECKLQQADAEVTLVWAYADQGDSGVAVWEGAAGGGSHSFGATSAEATVSHILDGLEAATTYAYRFYATNPHGDVWTEAAEFGTKTAGTGVGADTLVAYWNFDEYTETGDNPPGTPNGGHEGFFEDITGNGHSAFAAEVSAGDYAPHDPSGGKFGGAFYSETHNNAGALAVVLHHDQINFDGEDFTIAFWEKAQFRDVAGSGWGAGRGRSQFFMKAPHITEDGVQKGLGLNLTQNHFDLNTNNKDNFGQTGLGARYTYPNGADADDSGEWAHWTITGVYDGGTDAYTITTYLNGEAVTWNGGATSITAANDIISNEGDLTIGSFWRNNGWSPQRFVSWRMKDGTTQTIGKGWMDDFALWEAALSEGDIADLAAGVKGPLDIGASDLGLVLTIDHRAANDQLTFTWMPNSRMAYDIVSSADLSGTPDTWSVFAADVTSPHTAARPGNAQYFALVEREAMPLLSENFDGAATGWTTGHDDANGNTLWERNAPSGAGPAAAYSAPNCYGTNITGIYGANANTWLRSPAIDLTSPAITGATLTYRQFIDTDLGLDVGSARLLNADDGDAELAVLADNLGGLEQGWTTETIVLPPIALGKSIKIEFRFVSDDNGQVWAGFYVDDVEVSRN